MSRPIASSHLPHADPLDCPATTASSTGNDLPAARDCRRRATPSPVSARPLCSGARTPLKRASCRRNRTARPSIARLSPDGPASQPRFAIPCSAGIPPAAFRKRNSTAANVALSNTLAASAGRGNPEAGSPAVGLRSHRPGERFGRSVPSRQAEIPRPAGQGMRNGGNFESDSRRNCRQAAQERRRARLPVFRVGFVRTRPYRHLYGPDSGLSGDPPCFGRRVLAAVFWPPCFGRRVLAAVIPASVIPASVIPASVHRTVRELSIGIAARHSAFGLAWLQDLRSEIPQGCHRARCWIRLPHRIWAHSETRRAEAHGGAERQIQALSPGGAPGIHRFIPAFTAGSSCS